MWRSAKACSIAGCFKPSVQGSPYCEKHTAQPPPGRHAGRTSDEVDKLYGRAAWRKVFRPWFLGRHPLCQRLIKGERCREMATTIHHLVSPRVRPDLMLTASNCVALCANDHPGGEAGTPLWVAGRDFVFEPTEEVIYV
jgi:hypothetical protein